jgi:hypothetical protein
MTFFSQRNRGFLQLIIIIVIALIVLGYFGLNIQHILATPTVHDNLTYAWGVAVSIWHSYLAGPAQWVWENVGKVLWNLFLSGLGNLSNNNGQIPAQQVPVPTP